MSFTPKDPVALSQRYADQSCDEAERRKALGDLIEGYRQEYQTALPRPDIWGNALAEAIRNDVVTVARQVSKGTQSETRADFVDGASSIFFEITPDGLPRICRYDVNIGPLYPWLFKVLHRQWIGVIRKKSIQVKELISDPAEKTPDSFSEMLTTPLPSQDCEALGAMFPTVRNRVIMCCLAGISHLVPAELWEGWLVAHEETLCRKLPRPIPSKEFRLVDELSERRKILASLIGETPENLATIWNRCRNILRELPRFRDYWGRSS